MSQASTKKPLLISMALIVFGLVLGAAGGITSGSIGGGLIAATGAVPAGWATWSGMQGETQSGLAAGLGMLLLSVGVGGPLLLLGVIDLFR